MLEAEGTPATNGEASTEASQQLSSTSIAQLEERLLSQILARIDHHSHGPQASSLRTTKDLDNRPGHSRGDRRTSPPSTPGSSFSFLEESASAARVKKSVESLFPGVERGTLTQIVENRFKSTNIYRLLVTEKDKAEAHQVTFGGVSFEHGEHEGRESEYRIGPFFKAWASYCGILTMLAPVAFQGELGCALLIYITNLQTLAVKYFWEGVKAYHFSFHRKRVASRKEIFSPEEWQVFDAQLIASECFARTNQSSTLRTSGGAASNQPANTARTYTAPTGPLPPQLSLEVRQATMNAPCRNWNYRECRMVNCHYLHACISCGGGHRVA